MKTPDKKALLTLAYEHNHYEYLWEQAIPLVKLAMRKLMQDGRLDPYYSREDLLQDGMLAAGEAVRRWDPDEGAFSTWIMVKVRSALLDKIQAASSGMIGGRRKGFHVVGMHADSVLENPFRQDENREFGHEASMKYDEPPEELGDPADETSKAEDIARVRELLDMLPSDDRHMLMALYGIDSEQYTQEEYAEAIGISRATLNLRLASVKSFLRQLG